MNVYELPTSIRVGNRDLKIRSDYRAILDIMTAFDDVELSAHEKQYVCLYILYIDFDALTEDEYEEAYEKAVEFIDCGMQGEKNAPRTMDWEQDAPLIFPAINHVAGYEVRAQEYLHWWTFTGFFMEIRNTIYANVLSLRNKKAKGKKLEKHEQEFWAANKNICVLQEKLTEEEKEEKKRLLEILGENNHG